MVTIQPMEETRFIIVTESGPIDDRVFDTYDQAQGAREILMKHLMLEESMDLQIKTITVRKQLLIE